MMHVRAVDGLVRGELLLHLRLVLPVLFTEGEKSHGTKPFSHLGFCV